MENPLVPIDEDLNEIVKNIYMGNLETACNVELLRKYKIKRILSVLQSDIPDNCRVEGIIYKYINVWDSEYEDIISYFPECYEFIYEGQHKGENVFIHCRAGRSRSSAFMIAYMMKKYGTDFEDTIKTVTVLRNEISPNPGFRKQLRLWQRMNFVLLATEAEYRLVLISGIKNRIILIYRFVDSLENWNAILENINSAFLCFLQKVINTESSTKSLNKGKSYHCKSCSTLLFNEINLIRNSGSLQRCDAHYIEPQKWILQQISTNANSIQEVMSGNLSCLNCKEVLGTFDWHQNSYNCECETHKGLQYCLIFKVESNKLSD